MHHDCPNYGQRYVLDEPDDDNAISLKAEGEVEIMDETSGEVVRMTSEKDQAKPSIREKDKTRRTN